MYLNCVVELSMVLDNVEFHKLLSRVYKQAKNSDDNKYVDRTLASKGIMVIYQDQQYKKKVKLTINPSIMLNGSLIRTS